MRFAEELLPSPAEGELPGSFFREQPVRLRKTAVRRMERRARTGSLIVVSRTPRRRL